MWISQFTIKTDMEMKYLAMAGILTTDLVTIIFSGNGIVYGGNRKPSPKMQEVKFNYQNIQIRVDGDSFEVINKNLFTNTSKYQCIVTLALDGEKLAKATVVTEVEPLSAKVYKLPVFGYMTPWSNEAPWKAVQGGELCCDRELCFTV